MNRYHWFVLTVAALGWLFDCLDQQLFIMARQPAMKELLAESPEAPPSQSVVDAYSGYATAIFLIGWASGGLVFGVLGDRIGRAKTMLITILMYSLFTGLSSLSVSFWDFAAYRFLTGLGVGGEFAVGVALVAEVMPHRARPYALSLLQALSAIGNVSAALVNIVVGGLYEQGLLPSVWRPLFIVGAVPALLCLVIRRHLKEPERWQQVSHEGAVEKQLGSYQALFGDPELRRRALIGLTLAFSGVVGLWGIVFFTMDLVGNFVSTKLAAEGVAPEAIAGQAAKWKGTTGLMLNIGAFLGMYSFGVVTQRIGRKPTFAMAFVASAISTAAVFMYLDQTSEIYWMVPVMGFCILSLFAGYAIYFPELFPTYLRSTGTSFCYNIGRFLAAAGPAVLGVLTSQVYADTAEPLRNAGLTMCVIFVIGLIALPFAPETKDQPLPD
ncbi:MAG: MFS transporter [Planctomycetota bacterium]|nr:MAG: MFS transporter [Planctomycetota bacterium]REJ91321.1 MAG: MFS transporter [Planctomycetota bacterium]REK31392.1 MAG: MFS transporter [Planctomycetota bacterium]REK37346.1 MAG: MFS transporter [Planctomycetota bacterium]